MPSTSLSALLMSTILWVILLLHNFITGEPRHGEAQ